jgi:hypothetical protein
MATVKTVGTGKDYTTLAAWFAFAGTQASASQSAECYAGSDLGNVTMNTSTGTISSVNFYTIYAAAGNRHDGITPSTGARQNGIGFIVGMEIRLQYTQVIGMAYLGNGDYTDGQIGIFADNCTIDGCLAVTTGSAVGFNVDNAFIATITAGLCKNSIGRDTTYPFSANALAITANVSVTCTFDNCTGLAVNAASNAYSPYADAQPTFTATATENHNNCFGGNSDSDDYFKIFQGSGGTETINMTNTNCGSEDLTADDFGGSGNLVSVVLTDTFVNTSGGDLSLKPGAVLRNAGLSLVGTVDNDILQRGRPQQGTYDIGAHEYPSRIRTLTGVAV